MRHYFLSCLPGIWSLNRQISDGAKAEGIANIAETNTSHFSYHEEIQTILPHGQKIEGTQRYKIAIDTKHLALYFDTGINAGNLFQRFLMTADLPCSTHICGQDHYASTWEWVDAQHFILTHTVTSPRKNYVMKTKYWRTLNKP